MPRFERLSTIALVVFVSTISLVAAEKIDGLDRILLGRDGFTYFLVTQFKKKAKPDTNFIEVPIYSIDNSPIYEGIKTVGKEEVRVASTLKNLREHERLSNSPQPESRSPWVSQSLQVKLSPEIIQKFTSYIGKDFRSFQSIASGMTRDKAKLFYQLLFSDSLTLSTDAIEADKASDLEREATLEALSRSADNPSPEPTRVAIEVSFGHIFDFFFDWILDIFVDSIRLHFTKKEITANPERNSLQVKISADWAELTGVARQVGRIQQLYKTFESWPFRHGGAVLQVKKASIGAFEVEFNIQLKRDVYGFWRVQFLDPQRPLILRMTDVKPMVKIEYDGGRADDVRELSDRVIHKIEKILSATLMNAFQCAFFPDDFGMQLGVSIPKYEMPDVQNLETPNAQFETQLSALQFEPDGVRLDFDSRVNLYRRPQCLSNFHENPSTTNLKTSEASRPVSGQKWKLKSEYVEGTRSKFSDWHLDANQKFRSQANFTADRSVLDLISQASVLGGLYCASTRALWPRPGHMPLLEFRPTKFPEFALNEHKLDAKISGEMISYSRVSSEENDRFEEVARKNIEFGLSFFVDPDKKEIQWKPGEMKYSNSSVENELLTRVGEFMARPLLGIEGRGRAPLGSELLSKFTDQGVSLTDFRIDPTGVSAQLGVENFSWMRKASDLKHDKEEDSLPVSPTTMMLSEQPIEVHVPNVEIRWQANKDLFFSWRKKNLEDKSWGLWSPFEQTDRAQIHLEKPGRYYIQVKSMNRAFQIEQSFVQFEPFYQEDVRQVDLMKSTPEPADMPGNESKKPEASPADKIEAPPVTTLPSKGLFGCELRVGTTPSWMDWLSLFSAALVCLGLRFQSGSLPRLGHFCRRILK